MGKLTEVVLIGGVLTLVVGGITLISSIVDRLEIDNDSKRAINRRNKKGELFFDKHGYYPKTDEDMKIADLMYKLDNVLGENDRLNEQLESTIRKSRLHRSGRFDYTDYVRPDYNGYARTRNKYHTEPIKLHVVESKEPSVTVESISTDENGLILEIKKTSNESAKKNVPPKPSEKEAYRLIHKIFADVKSSMKLNTKYIYDEVQKEVPIEKIVSDVFTKYDEKIPRSEIRKVVVRYKRDLEKKIADEMTEIIIKFVIKEGE
jgi:hypothetical protein